MRKQIAISMYAYGCLSSIVAFVWFSAAVLSAYTLGIAVWLGVTLFLVHGCVLVVTFHGSRAPWLSVLRVTSRRLIAAKTVLLLAALNTLLWTGSIFALGVGEDKPWSGWVLQLFLASYLLLSTIYIALHWAFRPENLFPAAFIALVSNPFGLIVRKLMRWP
jgi:hypothetical protein